MKRKFVPTKIAVGVDRVNIKDFIGLPYSFTKYEETDPCFTS